MVPIRGADQWEYLEILPPGSPLVQCGDLHRAENRETQDSLPSHAARKEKKEIQLQMLLTWRSPSENWYFLLPTTGDVHEGSFCPERKSIALSEEKKIPQRDEYFIREVCLFQIH